MDLIKIGKFVDLNIGGDDYIENSYSLGVLLDKV